MNDITGIGKLIETLGSFARDLIDPYLKKKHVDTKVYELEAVSRAISTLSEKHGVDISYLDGQPTITLRHSDVPDEQVTRSVSSWLDNQLKQQENREKIIAVAANQLGSGTEVSEAKVDPDWVARFFSYSQDVSNEKMQLLWGKILAGEVSKPESYSLRTLDVVKNLTKRDAETFTRFAQYACIFEPTKSDKFAFIFNFESMRLHNELSKLREKFNFSYLETLNLKSVGLLLPDNGASISLPPAFDYAVESNEWSVNLFRNGGSRILLEFPNHTATESLGILGFSQVGIELLSLIEQKPLKEYDYAIAKLLSYSKVKAYRLPNDGFQEATGAIDFEKLIQIPVED